MVLLSLWDLWWARRLHRSVSMMGDWVGSAGIVSALVSYHAVTVYSTGFVAVPRCYCLQYRLCCCTTLLPSTVPALLLYHAVTVYSPGHRPGTERKVGEGNVRL